MKLSATNGNDWQGSSGTLQIVEGHAHLETLPGTLTVQF
jgi:hypothetical protein